ncbi:MBL fold metallo-hydrolase [Bacillus massiliigorillae]|uniref:MBL fold metallo-hydrolase n=1 Tax=Bacillus massiliigorillae TaxID=1243664 RepID=UPI00039FA45D|nr:MBL fold metallo-hydrolase [Bacillus massiliigorillae]
MINWENNIAQIAIPTPFPVGDINAYLIKGDALTLVDTGTKIPATKEVIQAGLKELDLEMSDIDQILLTHHHPDHVGGVEFFSSDIPLLGHAENEFWFNMTQEKMDKYEKFFVDLAKDMGVPNDFINQIGSLKNSLKLGCNRSITHALKEGDSVPGLPGWTVYETPGHAGTHIVLLREEDGALIGGDLLLQHVSPNPIIEPPLTEGESRPKAQLLLNASLRRLLQMPIQSVYAGHGEVIREPEALIHKRLASQHNRAMKVKDMLNEKPTTVFGICQQLFPKVYKQQFPLTISETLAQLDYLEDLREIKGEETEHGIVYSVK